MYAFSAVDREAVACFLLIKLMDINQRVNVATLKMTYEAVGWFLLDYRVPKRTSEDRVNRHD